MIIRLLAVIASLYGLLAVMLAALGSHVLPAEAVSAQKLWGTALQIHMFHAAVLLAVVALAQVRRSIVLPWNGLLMAAGVLVFSGSLYLRAAGIDLLPGAVTPFAGGTIMLSWLILIMILIRKIEF